MNVYRVCQCAILLCTVGTTAVAAEPDRFYVSLDVGRTSLQDSSSGPGVGDGTSFSLRGGFQFSRYFSVEAGYLDLGSIARVSGGPYCTKVATGTTLPTRPPLACQQTATAETRGAIANVRGSLPLGERFVLSGFVGAAFLEVRSQGTALVHTPDFGEACCYRNIEVRRGSGYQAAPSYGASVSWRAFDKLELSGEWTRVQDLSVPGEQVGYFPATSAAPIYFQGIGSSGEFDTFSIGLRLRF